MKKHSCGAILYTIYNNKVHIVLGWELDDWFPFKGTREIGENNKQAAIREIKEETCGALDLTYIDLKCNFSTKRKHYHIGLVEISTKEIDDFYKNKKKILDEWCANGSREEDYKWEYMEKIELKAFPLENIFKKKFHEISYIPIKYYHSELMHIQKKINNGKTENFVSRPIRKELF
jgi:ADP-ribose pyrophosphatase YjhB (NUDIX family)